MASNGQWLQLDRVIVESDYSVCRIKAFHDDGSENQNKLVQHLPGHVFGHRAILRQQG